MIAVLAHAGDAQAGRLVARWAAHDAQLVTPADLSRAGWRLEPGVPSHWSAAVGDRSVGDDGPLRGVLVRLAAVCGSDLPHIVAEDRAYVAAEMTAFLASWLTELRCPVVNRPSPNCLSGPGWRLEEWARAAVRLGIPVAKVRRPTPARVARVMATVTVAGRVGLGAPELVTRARRLAEAAGLRLAQCAFGAGVEAPLLGATADADLDDDAVAAGVLALFGSAA